MNADEKLLIESYEIVRDEFKNIGLDESQIEIELKKKFSAEELGIISGKKMLGQMDFKKVFNMLIAVLRRYIDMEDKYYPIVALWIIGTRFHDSFESYPYLFINASKGSGKTKLLDLISHLARGGILVANMTEAVLFRLPAVEKVTFCIDEAENLGSEENQNLRQLLNASYKKGTIVPRMGRKKKDEQYEVEKFYVYSPIAIANINGVDDVLEDRCIGIVLEKSYNLKVVTRLGWWGYDADIQLLKGELENLEKSEDYIEGMSRLIFNSRDDLLNAVSNATNATNAINAISSSGISGINGISDITPVNAQYWKQIIDNGIIGRELELWFPLFILAFAVEEELADVLVNIAKEYCKEKLEENAIINQEVKAVKIIYEYLAGFLNKDALVLLNDIVKTHLITDPNETWFNSRYLWRVIKRQKISKERHERSKGSVYVFDFNKIENKLKRWGIDVSELSQSPQTMQTSLPSLADV